MEDNEKLKAVQANPCYCCCLFCVLFFCFLFW